MSQDESLPDLTHLQRVVITPAQRVGMTVQLTDDQRHYLMRVLRLQPGDRFIVIDGLGGWWMAVLTPPPQDAELLHPLALHTELAIPIVLLMAMPKGNGMDDIVRQVTELGVATLVPIQSDRTLLQPSPQKLERWRRIAQEAVEQSERQRVPTLHAPLPWSAALAQWRAGAGTLGYLCTARGDRSLLLTLLQEDLGNADARPTHIVLAVGPEGGWTTAEVDQAIAAGYQPVSLGRRILRAITAPTVAVAIAMSTLESLSGSGQNV